MDRLEWSYEQELDARGMCVMPGLVDAHTHPVWLGDRVHEFAMKVTECTKIVSGMHYHSVAGYIRPLQYDC